MLRKSLLSIIRQLTYFKNQIVTIPHQIMFSTVKETHEYHNFIPWCKKSTILKKISQMQNYTQLTINFNDLSQISYVSHVVVQRNDECFTITSICKDSPLKYLKSVWTIKQYNDKQTNITYFLDFQFNSILYQLTSSIFLKTMGKSMMEIFVKRAREMTDKQINQNAHQTSQTYHSQTCNDIYDNNKKKQKESQTNCKQSNMQDYISMKPKLKELIDKNEQISIQVTKIANRLSNTINYTQKMNFQIRNMLTHHNISAQNEVFKQLL